MSKERTIKEIISDAVERELEKEPVPEMTPEKLEKILADYKKNTPLIKRIIDAIDTEILWQKFKRELKKREKEQK